MGKTLHILIVEDSADDAALEERHLRRSHAVECLRVDTPEAMEAALMAGPWDAVIADYSLPKFSGLAALQILKDKGLDLPFILVSGCIGEDAAVAAMKAGAHDYILKNNLARLGPAVARELGEAEVRRARKEAEEELHRARAELAQRVEERTAELSQANKALQIEIAERRRMDQSLREATAAAESANRYKSEFVANMSHEIRTPLHGVIGTLDLLQGTELTPQQRRYSQLAKSSAESLTALLNDILDFSKIEAGKLELVCEDFDLYTAVEDALDTLAHKAAEKHLELLCHFASDVPRRVRGDPDRLRQIIVNLVSNAIKFTDTGSITVRVAAEQASGEQLMMRLSVRDTGIGIAADRRQKLFRPFSQVDASTTRKYGGTGLGLTICRQLAELMGGQISVESEAGRGSEFRVTIRLGLQPQTAGKSRAAAIDATALRVLCVDDSPAQRDIMLLQLASWGIAASATHDGDVALHMLVEGVQSAQPFDLAIINSEMPDGAGIKLARTVRKTVALKGTALVALMSMENGAGARELAHEGFNARLTKPVRQSLLFDAVVDAIASVDASAEPEPDAARRPGLPAATSKYAGARVLLVEDNEVNQVVASEILQRAGLQVQTVGTGKAAVDAVAAERFAAVLMDCQMPEMDGFEATRIIRQRENEMRMKGEDVDPLPIVALTANAVQSARERCLAAGMDGYCTKPFKPQQLISSIDAVLGRQARAAQKPSPQPSPVRPGSPQAAVAGEGANAPRAAGDCFNFDELFERCGNDASTLRLIVDRFEHSVEQDLSRLAKAIGEHDSKQVEMVSHGLKGAASLVAATKLAQTAAVLEEMAGESHLENAAASLAELRDEVARCIGDMPRVLALAGEAPELAAR